MTYPALQATLETLLHPEEAKTALEALTWRIDSVAWLTGRAPSTVMGAVQAAIVGEAEPLRHLLGINVSDSATRAKVGDLQFIVIIIAEIDIRYLAIRGEIEPIRRYGVTVKYPRWKRLIPGWRLRAQRRILEEIEAEE